MYLWALFVPFVFNGQWVLMEFRFMNPTLKIYHRNQECDDASLDKKCHEFCKLLANVVESFDYLGEKSSLLAWLRDLPTYDTQKFRSPSGSDIDHGVSVILVADCAIRGNLGLKFSNEPDHFYYRLCLDFAAKRIRYATRYFVEDAEHVVDAQAILEDAKAILQDAKAHDPNFANSTALKPHAEAEIIMPTSKLVFRFLKLSKIRIRVQTNPHECETCNKIPIWTKETRAL
jgi:hypothetical protein